MKFAYLIEPPFNYVDDQGRVTGCDVELARYVLKELGIPQLDLIQTEFAALLPGLGDGRWQMTTGLFATPERRTLAQFSRTIWACADGLLVQAGNPHDLTGYASLASNPHIKLAVIRDQFQHRTAVEFGVCADQIMLFDTYTEAAASVRTGQVAAYASVARAHRGFIDQNPDGALDVVEISAQEKAPAYGSFAVSTQDTGLLNEVDSVLSGFIGSKAHRALVAPFGMSDADVDLVAR